MFLPAKILVLASYWLVVSPFFLSRLVLWPCQCDTALYIAVLSQRQLLNSHSAKRVALSVNTLYLIINSYLATKHGWVTVN
jgi:hypothetical protein